MFATQIGAAFTQGRCVVNAGYQKVYGSGKQSFVSVGCPEDDRSPHFDVKARMAGRSMSSRIVFGKK
eukprot:12546364-Ditylum_brightwellii.AAC.1